MNLPQLHGGAVQVVSVPATPELRAFVRKLAERAELVRSRAVDPTEDNMLKITSDGRKAALWNGPPGTAWPADRRTKVDALAERVWRHYHEEDERSGAQLIFLDLYTPKAPPDDSEYYVQELTDEERFAAAGAYGAVKSALVKKGVPPAEVAFAHEHQTAKKRAALHAAIRHGEVRACLGSTPLIGLGVNVQDRGCALHHLDCPWRPDEIEQRTKRFERQGNTYSAVHAYVYVTEGSYDPVVWQIVEGKARWQQQLYRGRVSRRTADDVGAVVLTASLAKAVALGDRRVLDKVRLEGELAVLEARFLSWQQSRAALRRDAERLPVEIEQLSRRAAAMRQVADRCRAPAEGLGLCLLNGGPWQGSSHPPQTLQPPTYAAHTWPTTLDDANRLLQAAWLRYSLRAEPTAVAEMRGHIVWCEQRSGVAALACYPAGQRPDGTGPAIDRAGFQSARPFEELGRLLEPGRMSQEARLLEARADDLRRRVDSVQRDLGDCWSGRAEADRLLAAYAEVCAGRAAQGDQPALEPLRDTVSFRFRW